MQAPTAIEKRRLFEGHALFGKLPPDDLDALLSHARVEHFSGRARNLRQGLARPQHDGDPCRQRSDQYALARRPRHRPGDPQSRRSVRRDRCPRRAGPHRRRHRDFRFLSAGARPPRFRAVPRAPRRSLHSLPEAPLPALAADRPAGRRGDVRPARRPHGEGAGAARQRRGAARQRGAVPLRLSQQELAGMVGATRESVNKQLQVWQSAGKLSSASGSSKSPTSPRSRR